MFQSLISSFGVFGGFMLSGLAIGWFIREAAISRASHRALSRVPVAQAPALPSSPAVPPVAAVPDPDVRVESVAADVAALDGRQSPPAYLM